MWFRMIDHYIYGNVNWIEINIHFIDMKRHMFNLFFFIFMLVGSEKEWGNYKMQVVSY